MLEKPFLQNQYQIILKVKKTIDNETVYNYLEKLENAYILHRCSRYDIQGKELLKTQEKFYLADTSLRHSVWGYKPTSISAMLENVVYLELCRRGYSVYNYIIVLNLIQCIYSTLTLHAFDFFLAIYATIII